MIKCGPPAPPLSHVKVLKKCIQYTFNKSVDFFQKFCYYIITKGERKQTNFPKEIKKNIKKVLTDTTKSDIIKTR